MEIIIFLLIIGAVGLVVWGIMLNPKTTFVNMPVDISEIGQPKPKVDFSGIFPTKGLLKKSGIAAKLGVSLAAAHIKMSAFSYFNLKLIICAVCVIVTIFIFEKSDPLFIIIALLIGYVGPDFYIKRRIARHKYLIARTIPETVDLLGLCIEAGLDFVNAVRWVLDKTPHTPMTDELAFVMEEIKWGKPRIQALKDMSRRIDIPEMTSFVQTIIQAERMGTPVAEAFSILSEDARAQRFHRGERIALQAPIKILLPLIFFIMPVIGIVIGGPILLQFMQGGLTAFK